MKAKYRFKSTGTRCARISVSFLITLCDITSVILVRNCEGHPEKLTRDQVTEMLRAEITDSGKTRLDYSCDYARDAGYSWGEISSNEAKQLAHETAKKLFPDFAS
jgi:hypothetical protein